MKNRTKKEFVDASVAMRNFSGRAEQFNERGRRNFAIFISEEQAEQLQAEGFSVRRTRPQNEGDLGSPFVKIFVNMDGDYPPKVYLVNSQGKVLLDIDTVGELDYTDIERWDVIATPWEWEYNGKTGMKLLAYRIYAVVEEYEIEKMYNE